MYGCYNDSCLLHNNTYYTVKLAQKYKMKLNTTILLNIIILVTKIQLDFLTVVAVCSGNYIIM